MDDCLQVLIDKDAIRDVVYRYCRAVDRCDRELARTVFHADAIEHHGGYTGNSLDYVERAITRAKAEWSGTQHRIGNILIELAGDIAFVESYFVAYHVRRADAADQTLVDILAGRYVDRFERRSGEWRIAQRVVVRDWLDTRPICDSGAADDFPLQRRDRSDALYQARLDENMPAPANE